MELDRAYEVLSLPYGSSLDEVKKAFRAEAQINHPDRFSNSSDDVKKRAEERFKLINEAYQVINEHYEVNGGKPPTPRQRPARRTYVKATEKSEEEIEQDILLGKMRRNMDRDLDSMSKDVWILVVLIICAFFFGMASLKSCATEPPPSLQTQY